MDKEDIIKYRQSLLGQNLRLQNLALDLHKETERSQDLIRILDAQLINLKEK